ncbi:UPF0149 family protein [Janthinobacterium sp.]|uniref:UPF0149 family protein n=1 Tax=Janthinobacterium sp. TaxID=1871054 RepID=UPI00293D4DC9|nr:UPF0149 family protein [Janthinobacterium sp.]
MSSHPANPPLSDEEYAALDALLAAPELGGRAMDVSMLEGFLTAIVISPDLVMPSQWLSWVWDKKEGLADLGQTSAADSQRILGLVMRHYNYMVEWLEKDPGSFDPIYTCGGAWLATDWCAGFLLGTQMDAAGWAPLLAGKAEWFTPFTRLGTAEGQEQMERDDDADLWMDKVPPAVILINAYWKVLRRKQNAGKDGASQRPVVREVPKVGRNDPCFCGSGKKFKKCCADAAPVAQ